jgi:hypothetical protein
LTRYALHGCRVALFFRNLKRPARARFKRTRPGHSGAFLDRAKFYQVFVKFVRSAGLMMALAAWPGGFSFVAARLFSGIPATSDARFLSVMVCPSIWPGFIGLPQCGHLYLWVVMI